MGSIQGQDLLEVGKRLADFPLLETAPGIEHAALHALPAFDTFIDLLH